MMEKLVNLTPHAVHVYQGGKEIMVIPQSGTIARTQLVSELDRTIQGIPVFRRRVTSIKGLPKPEKNVTYIVSSMVLSEVKKMGRTDMIAPDTNDNSVRTNNNTLLGVSCFRM
jgi:hypothetical protein